MIGRMLDQHHAQDIELVVVIVKNGGDDGKIQAYAFLPNLRRKLRLEIQQEGKSERLKKSKKQKRKAAIRNATVFKRGKR